jgi:hypothetical protein
MGAKLAIGDSVANTDVHEVPASELTAFIMGKLRSIRNIIFDLSVELPHPAVTDASYEVNLPAPDHEYVQIRRYPESA